MKKIVVALDIAEVNIKVVDFACYIAKLTHSRLTGVFIDNPKEPIVEKVYETAYVNLIAHGVSEQNRFITDQHEENIHFFEEACQARGVNYHIHYDRDIPIKAVITESRFADLLIVDPEMSFQKKPEGIPTGFIKEVLEKTECPAILVPSDFNGIEQILFTYDGSQSCVFSIKHFSYLFPELKDTKVIVLQINEKEEIPIVEKEKIRELLQNYYSAVSFQTANGKADDAVFAHLLGKKGIIVAMGAYGRGAFSDFFRRSTADLIVKTIDLPVFIAHP